MRSRSVILAVGSVALGAFFLYVLLRIPGVDLRSVITRAAGVGVLAFLRISILMAVNIFLASQKWKLVDDVLRRAEDPPVTNLSSFVLTAIGVAVAQVIPVQLSISLVRTVGTSLLGRAVRRGTIGTLYEQFFDVLVVCFLLLASLATWWFKGGPVFWLVLASVTAVLAIVAADPLMRLLHAGASFERGPDSWRRLTAGLKKSGLFHPILAQKLALLSIGRFVLTVLVAGQTARAINADIPVWHLAGAMPFVILSTALSITPGGLGLNELTYATGLKMFGTSLASGAAWALANRVLVAAAVFAIAFVATIVFATASGANAFQGRTTSRSKE